MSLYRARGGTGLTEALLEALKPLCAAKGKNFIKYSEEAAVCESSQDKCAIAEQEDIIFAAMTALGNLSFNKLVVQSVMSALFDLNYQSWRHATMAMKQEWVDCLSKRFRNMCYQAAQSSEEDDTTSLDREAELQRQGRARLEWRQMQGAQEAGRSSASR